MKLTIEIPDEVGARIMAHLVALPQDDRATSHGTLTLKTLAEMLMEDVDLSISRPGSWEGSKMGDLLTAHGYRW